VLTIAESSAQQQLRIHAEWLTAEYQGGIGRWTGIMPSNALSDYVERRFRRCDNTLGERKSLKDIRYMALSTIAVRNYMNRQTVIKCRSCKQPKIGGQSATVRFTDVNNYRSSKWKMTCNGI